MSLINYMFKVKIYNYGYLNLTGFNTMLIHKTINMLRDNKYTIIKDYVYKSRFSIDNKLGMWFIIL